MYTRIVLKAILTAFVLVLATTILHAQPANDACANAILITDFSTGCTSATTTGATSDVFNGNCVEGTENVWFRFTAPSRTMDIIVNGAPSSNLEITLLQWNGAPCTAAFQVACKDRLPTYATDTMRATGLQCGVDYYISITNDADTTEGAFDICLRTTLPPPNDNASTAAPLLGCDTTFNTTNRNAAACHGGGDCLLPPLVCNWNDIDNNTSTGNVDGADVGYSVENDVYWTFCPTTNATYQVTITPSNCNTTSGVQFSAFQGTATQFDSLLAGGQSGQNLTTATNFTVTITNFNAGCVFFEIDGFGGTECDINITMTCLSNCPAPATCTTFPVDLLSFRGTPKEEIVQLDWITTAEIDFDYFEVQRLDGQNNYQPLGRVYGSGTALAGSAYQFDDQFPLSGPNYYRLRMVDMDGAEEYSNTVMVMMQTTKPHVQLYPNPFSDALAMSWQSIRPTALELYTADGRLAYRKEFGQLEVNGEMRLEIQDLAEGMYFYRLRSETEVLSGSLIRQ